MATESWHSHQARLAVTKRHHPDADLTDLRRNLKAARLEDHVARQVAAWPELTPEQRLRIAAALLSHEGGGDAA